MGERRVQSVMGRDRQRMSMAYRRRGVALNAPIAKFRYRFLFVRDGRHFHVCGLATEEQSLWLSFLRRRYPARKLWISLSISQHRPAALSGWRNAHAGESGPQFPVVAA
jgi:hypothetical protein